MSGAVTGGVLAARAGPRAMASAAVVGGVLLALIEGMGIMFTKAMAPPVPTKEDYERAMRADPTAPPTSPNLFGGSFGGGGGAPPPPPSSSSTAPPPPSSSDSMDTETTFTTEGSSSSSGSPSGSSWFSFG